MALIATTSTLPVVVVILLFIIQAITIGATGIAICPILTSQNRIIHTAVLIRVAAAIRLLVTMHLKYYETPVIVHVALPIRLSHWVLLVTQDKLKTRHGVVHETSANLELLLIYLLTTPLRLVQSFLPRRTVCHWEIHHLQTQTMNPRYLQPVVVMTSFRLTSLEKENRKDFNCHCCSFLWLLAKRPIFLLMCNVHR